MNGGDLNQQQQQQQQQQQMQHRHWLAMQQQYQQQWMAMQYPGMAMQHPVMYNQHYVPYYPQQQLQYQQQQQQVQQNQQIQSSSEDNKTIWIGDLQQWMDEGYLQSCFTQTGEVISAKIIRNKQTGQSERYGFIEFNSHASAEKALQTCNGTTMPNTEQPFRLNWASFSSNDRRPDSDLSIFVGDLATDVTDALLHDTFASRYPSVKSAKVVVDSNNGSSKGYGFVRFGDENERSRAMTEMNGVNCSGRPIRVGVATPKKSSQLPYYSQGQSENDSINTTVFVGGLDSEISDDELRQSFIPFGEVLTVKIPPGKGCGFVQFANRNNAEEAIQSLSGTIIGKQTVRLSWGRSPGNKQMRFDRNDQWNGAYSGRQGYNGYGASSNGNGNHQQQPVS